MKDLTAVIAAIVGFGVTALSGYCVIPFLRKLKFGQTILDIGPNWHKEKQGTPTMGGIMMIFGFIVSVLIALIYSLIFRKNLAFEIKDGYRATVMIAGIALALCMAAIGFMDDYIKVVK